MAGFPRAATPRPQNAPAVRTFSGGAAACSDSAPGEESDFEFEFSRTVQRSSPTERGFASLQAQSNRTATAGPWFIA